MFGSRPRRTNDPSCGVSTEPDRRALANGSGLPVDGLFGNDAAVFGDACCSSAVSRPHHERRIAYVQRGGTHICPLAAAQAALLYSGTAALGYGLATVGTILTPLGLLFYFMARKPFARAYTSLPEGEKQKLTLRASGRRPGSPVGDTVEQLLHQAAFERINGQLERASPNVIPLVLCEDGSLRRGENVVSFTDAAPTAIWLSVDTLLSPHLPKLRALAADQAQLRWVLIGSAGVNDPLYKALYDRGVRLSSSIAQAVPVAEYVIASVFSQWYPRGRYASLQESRKWERVMFREICGSNWLIVGYGNIGQGIAERLWPFGVQLTAVRRRPAADQPRIVEWQLQKDLQRLLPEADVVVLAKCALTLEAIDMANKEFFAAMKLGSFFVNVGRGRSVDEIALRTSPRRRASSMRNSC